MHMAWHIAALSRAEKVPALRRLLARDNSEPRVRQTWQQMRDLMRSWVMKSGGNIVDAKAAQ